MYEGVTVGLLGPLCDCEVYNLACEFVVYEIDNGNGEKTSEAGLEIECGTCGIRLVIPPAKLGDTITISLETPYPKDEENIPKKKTKTDSRKVIPLFETKTNPLE